MNKKVLNKNIILVILQNIIAILFPIITFPYISKTLSVETIGRFNFIESILNFLNLIAIFGINSYAVREGVRLREDKEQFNKLISELFFINIITTLFSYFLMFVCVEIISELHQERFYIYLFSIQIIFYVFSMDWILIIYEKYFFKTIQTFVFKFLYIFLLFLFVRKSSDLLSYIIITTIITIASYISVIIYNKNFYKLRRIHIKDCIYHFKPICILFIDSLTHMIYTGSDIILLGFMQTDYIIGIYSFSVKIYTTLRIFLACILLAAYPRVSFLYGTKEYKKIVQYIYDITMLLMLPCIVGLLLVSKKLIFLIGNKQYIKSIPSLHILTICLLFSIIAWIHSQLILLPSKKDFKILKSTILSAIVNIILNIIFIPILKERATAISTLISEFVMFILLQRNGKDVYQINFINKNIKDAIIGCIGIFIVCVIVPLIQKTSSHFVLIITILLSILVYITTLTIMKNEMIISLFKNKKNIKEINKI